MPRSGGPVVRRTARTATDAEGDLHSVEAERDALAADEPVKAEGYAVEAEPGPPPGWRALVVTFGSDGG